MLRSLWKTPPFPHERMRVKTHKQYSSITMKLILTSWTLKRSHGSPGVTEPHFENPCLRRYYHPYKTFSSQNWETKNSHFRVCIWHLCRQRSRREKTDRESSFHCLLQSCAPLLPLNNSPSHTDKYTTTHLDFYPLGGFPPFPHLDETNTHKQISGKECDWTKPECLSHAQILLHRMNDTRNSGRLEQNWVKGGQER